MSFPFPFAENVKIRTFDAAGQILPHYFSAPSPPLPVLFRINFKILLLTFKAIHGLVLSYIRGLVPES